MSSISISLQIKNKIEPKNIFDDNFLNSKDIALQPIKYFLNENNLIDIPVKEKYLSLKPKKKVKKDKNSERSRKSQTSQQSQKSTSNTKSTNKEKEKSKKKSIKDSQLYSSNIIIVHYDDEEEESSTDPIEKEIEKLQKLMSKSKEKEKKKNKSSSKITNLTNESK